LDMKRTCRDRHGSGDVMAVFAKSWRRRLRPPPVKIS
jgi:hypothetical protein